MGQPTNGELKLMIENLHNLSKAEFCHNRDELKTIKDHLSMLNGQVAKNTKFRYQMLAYVPIAALLINVLVQKLINRL